MDLASQSGDAGLAKEETFRFTDIHTIDLNLLEKMLTGEMHQHLKPFVWETSLNVSSNVYWLLNLAVVLVVLVLLAVIVNMAARSFR